MFNEEGKERKEGREDPFLPRALDLTLIPHALTRS